ncbi:MAG TPA: TonB-dependent receptor [Bryobacteraceae bacterium]|nr:TonB-dependent receptor [Bryobacteraceae bacterium]
MTHGRFMAALLCCLAGPTAAMAQHYGHLSGSILDPSEAGVPGALITVVDQDTGFRRTTESRPDGRYLVASLQPGLYKVTVRKEGFRTVIRFGVRLEPRPARLDFALPVGSMQETITVQGTASAINREDASVGLSMGRQEIEHLPLNGRGLLSLLELAPGTVVTPATRGEPGQFTVNGQRPNTHYFTVDGASANTGVSGGGLPAQSTGGALPGMSAFGSLHSVISMEALQDFRVQTSTAVPEFGRLPGANVSLTSRSGSNEWHGSLVYGLRHEALAANDWFSNRQGEGRAPLRMHDFAQSVGGPVRRNHTFFFASYQGIRLQQPFAWRTPVPSMAARERAAEWARPVLDLYPVPNGADLGRDMAEWSGRNRRPSRLDAGSLRLDHALSDSVSVFGRYHDSPSTNEFGSAQVNRLELRARSLTFGLNARPGTGTVLDTRLNASWARIASVWRQTGRGVDECGLEEAITHFLRAPADCAYLARFAIPGLNDLVSGHEGRYRQKQFQVAQTAIFYRGAHTVRLGADYRRLAPSRRDASGTLSVIADSIEDLSGDTNLWVGRSGPRQGATVLNELSLLAQDTWRVNSRLTATYGVRWEFSPAPMPDEPAYFLTEDNSVRAVRQPLWPRAYRNIAPRLGVAFAPRASGRTVVRAGAGLYYDSSISIATDLVNGGPLDVWQHVSARSAPFSMLLSYGFIPDLRLPSVKQWSVSVEHALTEGEVISAAYSGSSGRHLVRREIGGAGSTALKWVALATNNGESDYHGLQLQYRRRMARGLRATVAYNWAHSIDNSSTDSLVYWAGGGATPEWDRGASDFDVRHALTAAFTWELPGDWAVDGIFRARTGFPITVLGAERYIGVSFANAFRPDLVYGEPLWIRDDAEPGGRRLNREAFRMPGTTVQGNLGRNAITGLGMSQVDLAVRRAFRFGERASLEVRVEAFNALNQANFADPAKYLVNPIFGQSPSMLNLMLGTGSPASGLAPIFQIGGARSGQAMLRLRF